MTLFALFGFVSQFITDRFVEAKIDSVEFEGPYRWNGAEYSKFTRIKGYDGFVDEYTNKEKFCHSFFFFTGLSLLSDVALGICLLLFLFWLFLGISILSDVLMDSIEMITSKSVLINIPDSDGNMIQVEKIFWNPTIANLTLMALGTSAPEIILSTVDTVIALGEIPSELGPQTIIGSASFNLLVISAISILASAEVKKINKLGVFFTTALFSTFAYVWFFLVLLIISPGVVELWEALVTLAFIFVLCILAYTCDVCQTKSESQEERRQEEIRKSSKAALRILVKKFGLLSVISVGQTLRRPEDMPNMSEQDVANIIQYFTTLLTVDPKQPVKPNEASVDDLLDCVTADNVVERIAYRRQVNTGNTKSFVRLEKGQTGETAVTKTSTAGDSKTIGFKHLRYEVAESNGYVTITIEKRIPEDFSFWIRTMDGTAKAGEDYEAKNEYQTMQAEVREREIKIKIHDDPNWEPDEEFRVQLWDADQQRRLPGNDTECIVLIQDEDKPGSIGFPDQFVDVRRKDKVAYITLTRTNGCDGEISCILNTCNDLETLPGKKAAKEGIDFVPIVN